MLSLLTPHLLLDGFQWVQPSLKIHGKSCMLHNAIKQLMMEILNHVYFKQNYFVNNIDIELSAHH